MIRSATHSALIFAALSLLPVSCSKVDITRTGRPCEGDYCGPGYDCHPVERTCVPTTRVGCGVDGAVCPEEVITGAPCPAPGAFIPCSSGYSDCEAGCRTCLPNRTWGDCSCRVGQLLSCRTCSDDCTASVLNAVPECRWVGGAYACGFEGDCDLGFVDRDGRPDNGCECPLTAGGVEICDGIDNNCNREIDEDNPCSGAALCEGAGCVPCTDSDAQHCGAGCARCAGTTPACAGGTCGCEGTSCGSGAWCDDGVCATCANDDPLHCGTGCAVCPMTLPQCKGGACLCEGSSCGSGAYCTGDGICAPCDDAAHCGPSCAACPAGHPICAPATGACTCSPGSCGAGSYCLNGACTACTCPTIFPSCEDLGSGTFRCNCAAGSCPSGGQCVDGGTTCQIGDDFEGASSLLSLCPGPLNNSWQRGTPNYGTFTSCANGSQCWGTNLTGTYNNCELSCLDFPLLPLAGIDGTVEISMAVRYSLEYQYDGATVRFFDGTGWQFVAPDGGWDINPITLGNGCTGFPKPSWPGWGQYTTDAAIGWVTKRFVLDSMTHAGLFTNGFYWRLAFVSDWVTAGAGFYVDDVVVRVHQRP